MTNIPNSPSPFDGTGIEEQHVARPSQATTYFDQMNERKIREVRIKQLDNGYMVEVECQRFAFETAEALIINLRRYILEPKNTERKLFNFELFNK